MGGVDVEPHRDAAAAAASQEPDGFLPRHTLRLPPDDVWTPKRTGDHAI